MLGPLAEHGDADNNNCDSGTNASTTNDKRCGTCVDAACGQAWGELPCPISMDLRGAGSVMPSGWCSQAATAPAAAPEDVACVDDAAAVPPPENLALVALD